jgi:hypothetical protein
MAPTMSVSGRSTVKIGDSAMVVTHLVIPKPTLTVPSRSSIGEETPGNCGPRVVPVDAVEEMKRKYLNMRRLSQLLMTNDIMI